MENFNFFGKSFHIKSSNGVSPSTLKCSQLLNTAAQMIHVTNTKFPILNISYIIT